MRTTLTLEEDLAQKLKDLSQKMGVSFKSVLNEALRQGLKNLKTSQSQKPYKTDAHPMKLRENISIDNIQEMLADLEGEEQR